jgi:hypothetical protein
MSFPDWVWLFFGSFGTVGAVLFTVVVWYWLRVHASAQGWLRSAAKWNMLGLMFLFMGAYFACGIGGPPGSLLSKDPSIHDLGSAYDSAILSIVLSVPGWACVLMGVRRMLHGTRADGETT